MFVRYAAIISSLTVITVSCRLVKDYPKDIVEDFTSIFTTGTAKVRICNTGIISKAALTEYWIYTRDNPSDPTVVKQPNITATGNRSKIVFLSHGWLQNGASPSIAAIKDAYLERYDAYVVSLNWIAYSLENYFCSYVALSAIAENIADALCNLKQSNNVNLEDIHVVGHSLGAQLFGITGRLVTDKCEARLGRITGLDPAGPLYVGVDPRIRLNPFDALYVDVIHTAVGTAGYLGSLGQLDAYANCGYVQPGCGSVSPLNITAILALPAEVITCSHERSCYYFAESINSDQFIGKECVGCGVPLCGPQLLGNEKQVIGEDNNMPGNVRNYVFYTNPSSPYAKG